VIRRLWGDESKTIDSLDSLHSLRLPLSVFVVGVVAALLFEQFVRELELVGFLGSDGWHVKFFGKLAVADA